MDSGCRRMAGCKAREACPGESRENRTTCLRRGRRGRQGATPQMAVMRPPDQAISSIASGYLDITSHPSLRIRIGFS